MSIRSSIIIKSQGDNSVVPLGTVVVRVDTAGMPRPRILEHSMKIRRPEGLTLVSTLKGLWLYDSVKRTRWSGDAVADGRLADLLVFCGDWREITEVSSFFASSGVANGDACPAVHELVEAGLLETDLDTLQPPGLYGHRERWSRYGWGDAWLYHRAVTELPLLDYAADGYSKDVELMQQYVSEEGPPSNYKDYETALIPLLGANRLEQKTGLYDSISSVMRPRPPGDLPFDDFSAFVSVAFGQTGTCVLPVTGRHVLKTAPSGGSRHPTEVYIVVLRSEVITPGLYHYNVRKHGLSLIKPGDHGAILRQSLFVKEDVPGFEPSAVLIYTCIFERSMFRYRESRSYRVVHHDLGHLIQNAACLASAIGWLWYTGYTFRDRDVELFMGVNSLRESAMGYTALA